MKISVNTALKQKDIIEVLDGNEINGCTFSYVETKGMNIIFRVNVEDGDQAIKIAKSVIKATPFGNAILMTFSNLG